MAISAGIFSQNSLAGSATKKLMAVHVAKGITVYDGRVYKKTSFQNTSPPEATYDMRKVRFEIFLSDDGAELLKIFEENKRVIFSKRNLIQIFIETNDDIFTERVMKVIAGRSYDESDIDLRSVLSGTYSPTKEQIDELLDSLSGNSPSLLSRIWDFLRGNKDSSFSASPYILDMVIKGIDSLRLSDRWWQPYPDRFDDKKEEDGEKDPDGFIEFLESKMDAMEDYFYKIPLLISKNLFRKHGASAKDTKGTDSIIQKVIEKVTEIKNSIREMIRMEGGMLVTEIIAMFCGLWNGIVDMVSGLIFITKELIKGEKAFYRAVANRDRILEDLDNFYQLLSNVKWSEVFITIAGQMQRLPSPAAMQKAIKNKWIDAKTKADIWMQGMPYQEFWYYLCYGITLIFPFGYVARLMGKGGKAGKVFGKFLLAINDALEKALGFALKKAKPNISELANIIAKLKKLLNKGTPSLINVIKKICDWFIEALDNFVKVADEAAEKAKIFFDEFGREVYVVRIPGSNLERRFIVIDLETVVGLFKSDAKIRNRLREMVLSVTEEEGKGIIKQGDRRIYKGPRVGLKSILKSSMYRESLILEEDGLLVLMYNEQVLFRTHPEHGFVRLVEPVFKGVRKRIEKELGERAVRAENITQRVDDLLGLFDSKTGQKIRPHEVETMAEAEVIYNTKLQPSAEFEAGDGICTSGIYKGKSIDAMGTPASAFRSNSWKTNFDVELELLLRSVDKHFAKIHSPNPKMPRLDKIIFDFKNYDMMPGLREKVMVHIKTNHKNYLDKGYIDFIN